MSLRWELVWQNLPFLIQGAGMTLKITLLAVVIGISFGTLLGMGRLSRFPLISVPIAIFVEFMRGTPLLVQLFLIFFGLPQLLQVKIPEFAAGVLAFGLNSSAYVAEIVRAGIQSIDRGQSEAGHSLGLSPAQIMRYIVLPQTFKRVLPPLVNESISLLKNSSLVATIAVVELLRSGQMVIVETYRPFEMYIAVSMIYLIMTLSLSQLANYLERRWRVSD